MRLADDAFGRGLAGVAGQTFLAVERTEDVAPLVESLRAARARDPIVGPVRSLQDLVPPDQDRKLAVLCDLRALIDEAARARDAKLRAELELVRPPDQLSTIAAADLPRELTERFAERDGSVGRLIAVRPGASFDEWNGRDLLRFAAALRSIDANGRSVIAAGPSLLFADVLTAVRRDGTAVTLAASLGIVALILAAAGTRRRALAVLASTVAGTLAMTAACALAGLKIDFLDFVAFPITLGLGVDYAINLACSTGADPRAALRSTGGTVLVCSLTTIIGYASLLASDNLAIRGFGVAALIGEVTCVLAALILVPALTRSRWGSPACAPRAAAT
jgi:hypothetical protein